MKKVYLAGPFFNDEQRDTMSRIEGMCESNEVDFFSPRVECLCSPDADETTRKLAFQKNVDGIREGQYVLARIDDFDPGTVWEMGYAFGVGTPVFAFTTVENRGLNLMLAASGVRIIQGWAKLSAFLGGDLGAAIQWKKSII